MQVAGMFQWEETDMVAEVSGSVIGCDMISEAIGDSLFVVQCSFMMRSMYILCLSMSRVIFTTIDKRLTPC